MTLGQRVAVLNKGVIQQVDTPQGLYRRPANTFVASFIGSPPMNFVRGRLVRGAVELGRYRIELPDSLSESLAGREGDVLVGLRPESFEDARLDGAAAPRLLPAEIAVTEQVDDGERGERGAREGQDDAPEDRPRRGAVDRRRLDQAARDRPEEAR